MEAIAKNSSIKTLIWGFVGVALFSIATGVEQTWLSKYIAEQGMDNELLFVIYGVAVAVSSWLSGVIAETIGVRRTMMAGYAIFVAGMAALAGVGMAQMSYPIIVATYILKGLGYPLFIYTFIVWITYRIGKERLGTALGWFWVMCTGGMDVVGAYYGVAAKSLMGVVPTLWTTLAFATAGALLALWANRSADSNRFAEGEVAESKKESKIAQLLRGLAIIKHEPKVAVGGVVRMINTLSYSAFLVFMPLYLMQYGIDDTEWATIWGTAFSCNIVCNVIFGTLSDRIGWAKTIMSFGGVGCAVAVALFYYSPLICNDFWFILLCGSLWGVMLAGFVPLGALVPSLVEKNKGAAISVLNLGAGMASFCGPLLVKAISGWAGYQGVAWALVAIYLSSVGMTWWISRKKRA